MSTHHSAIVSPSARIAKTVDIGPFCIIEDDVEIGEGCQLASGVVIKQGTRLGEDNLIDVGAVLGGQPQHLGAGESVGSVILGDRNHIREHVTVHRALHPDQATIIGNNNMLMVGSHLAHDCHIGDHNILANNVMLAGHVEVGDRNYFGGGSAVHQFCRVGSLTMIGGLARITKDVPPYVMVDGDTGNLVGLNRVGLRRAGMPKEQRQMLKEAYRCAFRDEGSFEERLQKLDQDFSSEAVAHLYVFLKGGTRGFLKDRARMRATAARNTTRTAVVEPVSPEAKQLHEKDTEQPRILPFRRAA